MKLSTRHVGEVGEEEAGEVWEAQNNFKDLTPIIKCFLRQLPKVSKWWVHRLLLAYWEVHCQPMKDPVDETFLWCPSHKEVQGKSFCFFLVPSHLPVEFIRPVHELIDFITTAVVLGCH